MREKHLEKAFKQFGKIDSINVPLNNANNQNRGFGFVEFANKADA
jgi:RNA recognition motif-containing protein